VPAGFGEADAESAAVESDGGGDGHGAVASLELSGAAGLSVFGSESAWPGVAATVAVTTVLSAAAEVTAGDFIGLGKVTAESFDPLEVGLAGAASACFTSAGFASAGDDGFGLVLRVAAVRGAVAGAGFAPEEEADRVFSGCSAVSADVDEEPSASAAVRLEDLSSPSGLSPFLLTDSGLGSTLFRTTVSG
jgi:hypothetical protein